MAQVELTRKAQQQADELPKTIRARLYRVIQRLENWPNVSGAKPLRGNLAGHYRIRSGAYRIQFYVTGDVVCIDKIGHRDDFYD